MSAEPVVQSTSANSEAWRRKALLSERKSVLLKQRAMELRDRAQSAIGESKELKIALRLAKRKGVVYREKAEMFSRQIGDLEQQLTAAVKSAESVDLRNLSLTQEVTLYQQATEELKEHALELEAELERALRARGSLEHQLAGDSAERAALRDKVELLQRSEEEQSKGYRELQAQLDELTQALEDLDRVSDEKERDYLSQIEDLSGARNSLEERRSTLELTLAAQTADLAQRQGKVHELRSLLSRREQQLSATQSSKECLEHELRNAQVAIESGEKKVEELSLRGEELRATVGENRLRLRAADNDRFEIQKMAETERGLVQELKELRHSFVTLEQEFASVKESNECLLVSWEKTQGELEGVLAERDTLLADAAQIRERLDVSEKKCETVLGQLSALEIQNSGSKARLQETEAILEGLRVSNLQQTEELQEMELLRRELRHSTERQDSLRLELGQATNSVERLTKELAEQGCELDELLSQIEQMELAFEVEREEKNFLAGKFDVSSASLQKSEEEGVRLCAALEKAIAQKSLADLSQTSLRGELDTKCSEADLLRVSLAEAQQKCEDLEARYQGVEQRVTESESAISAERLKLGQSEAERSELREKSMVLRKHLSEALGREQKLKAEVLTIELASDELKTHNRELTEKRWELESELSRIQSLLALEQEAMVSVDREQELLDRIREQSASTEELRAELEELRSAHLSHVNSPDSESQAECKRLLDALTSLWELATVQIVHPS